ncbi:hypothetical protein D0T53_11490 [Dysgonomonas sp. 216]|uniref:peptidylprolyl isomerase n=1 Tax=Dysgonomonas sp. 216 TaxID=2302934 RepID=UPI0013D0A6DC|nr:peptidylprolyl isomerase [Dysgonomonas sp. 216]NDW19528.1 hypothetical protein [Dysgonomonas sp. 216]
MAALQKIRDKSGLLVGVIAVALLAFVIPWNEVMAFFNESPNKAFVVDGESVTPLEYQKRVNELVDFQEMMGKPVDEATRNQIYEYVFEQMVKEKMLDRQAELLGLAVTQDEMNDMVNGEDISPVLTGMGLFNDPQTGQFNREGMLNFINFAQTDIKSVPAEQREQLQMIQRQWAMLKNMMKYNRLEEKYIALVAVAGLVNDVDAKENFQDSKYRSNVAYVMEHYNSIPDSTISVSQKEIDNLYKQRKNNYKTDYDSRKVSYFVKNIYPSADDIAKAQKEIDAVYENLKTTTNPALLAADYPEVPYYDVFLSEQSLGNEEKEFVKTAEVGDVKAPVKRSDAFKVMKLVDNTVAPDSVKLQMIVLPEGEDKTLAEVRTDSLLNVLKGGKDFATVANEINPQANGGNIGWVTEQMLASADDELLKKCFETPKGEIAKLNFRGMIQILKVEDRTRPVTKYKVATIQVPIEISEKTQNIVDSEINQFIAENADGKEFAKNATEKGYNLISDATVSPRSYNIGSIADSRQIVQWAFREEVGSIKKFEITANKSNLRVVARINSKIDKGYIPVSEVNDALKAELIKDKKAEKIITDLKAKNITSLDGYVQAIGAARVDTVNFLNFSTASISKVGREPILNAYSGVAPVNQLVGPVKGNIGVYILKVLDRTEQDTEYDALAIKQGLDQNRIYSMMGQIFNVLKEKMEVEDYRIRMF